MPLIATTTFSLYEFEQIFSRVDEPLDAHKLCASIASLLAKTKEQTEWAAKAWKEWAFSRNSVGFLQTKDCSTLATFSVLSAYAMCLKMNFGCLDL